LHQREEHRQPFPKRSGRDDRTSESGKLYADLCGPIQKPSINVSRYMLLLKDNYSWYVTYFIARKHDVCEFKGLYEKGIKFRNKIKDLKNRQWT